MAQYLYVKLYKEMCFALAILSLYPPKIHTIENKKQPKNSNNSPENPK